MREPIRDKGRLEHILTSIDNIFDFADGKSITDLSDNKMLFFAVVKNIEIIGEAAHKLTDAFKNQHQEVPWPYIIKMRHVLVHDYYQISVREVWKVIREDLGPLRQQIASYLSDTDWNVWTTTETS
ncbi:MAG: DUF86 domain-containing protein [Bacteroidaceae bacterium]|nr:DUF86 domain-containing protein [Bacteroidaceae bacterium]